MNEDRYSSFQTFQFDKYLSSKQKDIDIQALPRLEMLRDVKLAKMKSKLRKLLEDQKKS